jgi:hypothetical protein
VIWFVLGSLAVVLAVGLFLLRLLRLLTRYGRRDRPAERAIWFVMLYFTAHAGARLLWPHQPLWYQVLFPVPPLLACFGLLIRRYPETLFTPATIRRWRAVRGRLNRHPAKR